MPSCMVLKRSDNFYSNDQVEQTQIYGVGTFLPGLLMFFHPVAARSDVRPDKVLTECTSIDCPKSLLLSQKGAAFHLSKGLDGSCLWRHLACHACPHRQVLSLKTIFFLLENRWVPPAARSSFISQTYMGGMIGIVLSFPLCALIITHFGHLGCIIISFSFTFAHFYFGLGHAILTSQNVSRPPTI